jgi:hypothetical protein
MTKVSKSICIMATILACGVNAAAQSGRIPAKGMAVFEGKGAYTGKFRSIRFRTDGSGNAETDRNRPPTGIYFVLKRQHNEIENRKYKLLSNSVETINFKQLSCK